jgi:hypothetical protein
VSGAQIVALFAARNAGIGVPEEAMQKALSFILRCQNPDGGVGYTGQGGQNAAKTAIGVLVFALAKKQKTQAFQNAFAYLRTNTGDQNYYHYYLYYAAQAFFQASLKAFNEWNAVNVKALQSSQTDEGGWVGPFGPTFTTSASRLSLALNYRLLPIYER